MPDPEVPDLQFEEPRLTALYDEACAGRRDTEFYAGLAARLEAASILDVGCGTGVLAVLLAAAGHRVTGLDPGVAMLDVARGRPGGDSVTWLAGDASVAPTADFDLAVMTGHVAQVFTDEDSWRKTLSEVRRALSPGGRVGFELRHPAARAWTSWNPEESWRRLTHPVDGPVTAWVETLEVERELVTFRWSYEFERTGERLRSTSRLRFPAAETIEHSLHETGFTVESRHGDWDGTPVGPASPEMIYVARRDDAP